MSNAIVDSGASRTYVDKHVLLSNEHDSDGLVWCANGEIERVASEGDVGPLENVQKINSFKRSLISVRDLVDKFDTVIFDADGVHVRTCRDGKDRVTTIGRPLESRLYSFMLDRLARHDRETSCASLTQQLRGGRGKSISWRLC